MKNLLPKFSKVPRQGILPVVAVSLVVGSLSALQPAHAADAWELFRHFVNDAYARSLQANRQRGPVTTQIDRAYRAVQSACPAQAAQAQPRSTLSSGRLVEVGNDAAGLVEKSGRNRSMSRLSQNDQNDWAI